MHIFNQKLTYKSLSYQSKKNNQYTSYMPSAIILEGLAEVIIQLMPKIMENGTILTIVL